MEPMSGRVRGRCSRGSVPSCTLCRRQGDVRFNGATRLSSPEAKCRNIGGYAVADAGRWRGALSVIRG